MRKISYLHLQLISQAKGFCNNKKSSEACLYTFNNLHLKMKCWNKRNGVLPRCV